MSNNEKHDAPCFWAQAIPAGLLSGSFWTCRHPKEPRTLVATSYCKAECPHRESEHGKAAENAAAGTTAPRGASEHGRRTALSERETT